VSLRVELADRLKKLPPYLFAEIDRQKKEARAKGADLVDLGIGDPDLPTPPHVIDALARTAREPKNHRYRIALTVDKARIAEAMDRLARLSL
jgi:LL-diaminopimelate aminotransferase